MNHRTKAEAYEEGKRATVPAVLKLALHMVRAERRIATLEARLARVLRVTRYVGAIQKRGCALETVLRDTRRPGVWSLAFYRRSEKAAHPGPSPSPPPTTEAPRPEDKNAS